MTILAKQYAQEEIHTVTVKKTAPEEIHTTPTEIRAVDVKGMIDGGREIVLLDARSTKEWGESDGKIPGALRVHITEIEDLLDTLPKEVPVITYCTCRHEKLSIRVTQMLADRGFSDAHFLLGGFDAWVSAGYPLEPKPKGNGA